MIANHDMDIMVLMQFSDLTRDAGRQAVVCILGFYYWPLCVHGEFRGEFRDVHVCIKQ